MHDMVRVGIVGTSWWADWMYLPSLTSHSRAVVAALCGRDRQRAAELAAAYGVPEVFVDYRKMIAAANLDALVVAVPDDLHHPITMAALDAGLHVLCEKPMANNARDARAMLARAEAAGVKHMVLFTWRWQPHFALIKKMVEEGFLGQPHHARFSFVGGQPRDKSYKWRFDARRANGVAGDIGSHMIDFARWYLGEIASVTALLAVMNVREAAADGTRSSPANDLALVTLGLRNGALAAIELSQVAYLGDQDVKIGVQLHGDAGTIEAETIFFGCEGGSTLRAIRHGETHFTTLYDQRFAPQFVARPDLLKAYDREPIGPRLFIDAIVSDRPASPDFLDGVRAQEVVDAILRSDAEGRTIALEPA